VARKILKNQLKSYEIGSKDAVPLFLED
jgi:hypothetical protein